METILKVKFKLGNDKTRTISLKNAKENPVAEDVKAFGKYIVDNAMIQEGGHGAEAMLEAKMYSIEEKDINIE